MENGINILSLFDGISCGQIALERAGIKVANYYASEIDEKAIQVTQKNYPNTIQIGSVSALDTRSLPNIELLHGGSPCQSFSFAGKRNGMSTIDNIEITTLEQYLELKNNNFQFEGQSYLFWEYVRVLKEVNPKYFLLENVKMQKKWQDIITKTLDVEPIEINSALVSAQNRRRLYWTNIPNVCQPKDKNIILDKVLYRLPHGYMKEEISFESKYPTLAAQSPGTKHKVITNTELSDYAKSRVSERKGNKLGLVYSWYNDKVHVEKSPTLTCNSNCWSATGGIIVIENDEYRILSPEECEKLQTLPENYTNCLNKTARYKAIGNGWTVDVISHIYSFLPEQYKSE